jgi:drug/metabolite transporter (DMT)-like permease
MISSAFVFAAMGALTHALGSRCDWLTVALVRSAFMFVAAVAVARAAGAKLVLWRPRTLWLRSLVGSFSLVCNFYALTRLPVGDVLTITNTYPLWILALSWLALRERPRPVELAGVACGLAGVALIQRPHLRGDNLAAAVALASSFSTAVAMIGLHRLRGVDARAVVAHFAGVASLVAAVWLVARDGLGPQAPASVAGGGTVTASAFPAAGPVTLLLLLGVGVTGTVGQIFLTKAYAAGAPARVAVLGLTQVVFGMGFDVALWHRSLPPASLAGTVLVLAPTAWLLRRAGGLPEAATAIVTPADGAAAVGP